MLRKSNGFFLIELLLSLSALLMLALFFVPLLADLNAQSQQLERESLAEQLLFEELNALMINGTPSLNHSIFRNGNEYKITWGSSSPGNQKEVCVTLEKKARLPGKTICRFAE
ncbi:hypothetical protein ACQYAD_16695 [Neobacillus sp. SM06]|uniref:hypothetical protein n=1 Tax=Neobacillus sp. SM06 TaxID=3422492 RepID=UPI003D281BDE